MEELKKNIRGTKKENFNPLKNEKVHVAFIKSNRGMVTDPKSPLAGNLSETSIITYAIPRVNGMLKPVLTPEEEEFFENAFNLPEGSMNINAINNNYWTTYGKGYINRVSLSKLGKTLDLGTPIGMLEYKILLANNDYICPSQEELENNRKSTYMFVLNSENQVADNAGKKADIKFSVYDIYGQYKDDADMLRTIAYLVEHKKVSPKTKIEMLKDKIIGLMDSRTNEMYDVMSSKTLEQKKAIIVGVEKNVISERNGFYYLVDNGQKLCEDFEEPTLNNAANYLANPVNQELYFNIQKKIK